MTITELLRERQSVLRRAHEMEAQSHRMLLQAATAFAEEITAKEEIECVISAQRAEELREDLADRRMEVERIMARLDGGYSHAYQMFSDMEELEMAQANLLDLIAELPLTEEEG